MIGITGKIGSGKDTIADYLVSKHNYTKLSLAEPIKSALAAMLDEPIENFYDRELKEQHISELGLSRRQLAEALGTEWGRYSLKNYTGNQDFWVKLLEYKIFKNNFQRIVIPDVRFDNEVNFIRKNNGIIINVIRPNFVTESDHVSNNNNLSYDVRIYNNSSTVEEFLNSIESEIQTIVNILDLE